MLRWHKQKLVPSFYKEIRLMKQKIFLVVVFLSCTASHAVAEENNRRKIAVSRLTKLCGQQARKQQVFQSKSDRVLAREVKNWRKFLARFQQKRRKRFEVRNSLLLDGLSTRLQKLSVGNRK